MDGIIYHSVDASNSKATYGETDTLDFILSNDASRDLLLNAQYGVRIEGKIRVNETGATRQTDSEIVQMDHLTGIHENIVKDILLQIAELELLLQMERML